MGPPSCTLTAREKDSGWGSKHNGFSSPPAHALLAPKPKPPSPSPQLNQSAPPLYTLQPQSRGRWRTFAECHSVLFKSPHKWSDANSRILACGAQHLSSTLVLPGPAETLLFTLHGACMCCSPETFALTASSVWKARLQSSGQEDQKFSANLSYAWSLKPAWDGDTV